uniref:Phage zinc binding domain-containing protein n=1 Tax=Mycolicibacterium phage phi1_186018 TaxID=3236641 RepID=A0AB39AL77_9CAUD
MYDPADITEPPTCEDCGGYVNDHDATCRTGQGITSDLENTLDAEAADWALAHDHAEGYPCNDRCTHYPAGEQIITILPDPTPDEQRQTWFNLPEGGPW